ncbi:MAG: endonuclease/exonuclease/phosphatase family protein [Candidatus Roizmanbacteria bacterium]|nr:endonuclease/exonuclease/phosphatase family protein [Candidatus Roizmanbacteria bacterium]
MILSLLTYNTLFNNAADKIDEVIDEYHPDIVCLQEALTDDMNIKKFEKLGYKMADYSNSFVKFGKIFGVITFYNQKTITYKDSFILNTGTNFGEYFFYLFQVILGYNKPKTILRTDFIHKPTKKRVSVCNVHLYAIGSNEQRIKHINNALKSINASKKEPLIISGDFNYFPYKRRGLEKMMAKYGLLEATANIRQTMRFNTDGKFEKYNLFQRLGLFFIKKFAAKQIKTDYSFYRGLKLIKTEKIEAQFSDHYPILSNFSL